MLGAVAETRTLPAAEIEAVVDAADSPPPLSSV
jgi:hypothetical protein